MEKIRIYELAKELNTTSRRLIEKLAEINIDVKNHMSYLDVQNLKALYKHIGVISYDKEKPEKDTGEKIPVEPTPQNTVESQKRKTKISKDEPRIIRTTKTIIDNKKDDIDREKDGVGDRQYGQKGRAPRGRKHGSVRVSAAGSGLRTGYVRDMGPVIKKDKPQKPETRQDKPQKPEVRQDKPQKVEKRQEKSKGAEKKDIKKPKIEVPKEDTKKPELEVPREDKKMEEKIKIQQDAPQKDTLKDMPKKKTISEKTKSVGKSDSMQEKVQKETKVEKKKKDADVRAVKPDVKVEGTKIKDVKIEIEDTRKTDYKNKTTTGKSKQRQKKDSQRLAGEDTKKKKIRSHEILSETPKHVSRLAVKGEDIDEVYEKPKARKPKKQVRGDTERKGDPGTVTATKRSEAIIISIPEKITVKDLSESLKKTSADVIKKLMNMGLMVTVNEEVDFDTAAIIADEFRVKAERAVIITEEDILFDDGEDDTEDLVTRPPVVVVMGHVDHGKTSLLDAIRKTNVIKSEEGGITQHIGAYTVEINNRNITFLDTPGHEAFTAMRARGAQVTDIAILVVSADDGIMPQTIEAINHAKAAGINVIVAINKMDKPGANPDRIKQQLTEHELVPEEWGGDIIVVPISALKGDNIDLLLEMVLLTSDMLELKANPEKQAKGTVIEARLDKNRGPVATLLVQRGTLRIGDSILAGTILGRIRAMTNDKNQNIDMATPSTPVEILGFSEVPESGEVFYAIKDERLAKNLVDKRKQKQREEQLQSSSMITLEDLFQRIKEGKVKELNIIIKADVQGSVEAVKQSMEQLSTDEVKINIVHGGVGGITETDVKLAEVSNAIIIGFNVRPGINVAEIAKSVKVDMRLYRVIYDAIADIESAMKGMLEPRLEEVILGHAEIRQIFRASGVGTIGGSYVIDGKITRNSDVRVVRDSIVVHEGKLASLKRFKDDVREITQGYECGILLEKFNDIKEGDIVEAYVMEEV